MQRYELAHDAKSVIDKVTGQRWSAEEVVRILLEPDPPNTIQGKPNMPSSFFHSVVGGLAQDTGVGTVTKPSPGNVSIGDWAGNGNRRPAKDRRTARNSDPAMQPRGGYGAEVGPGPNNGTVVSAVPAPVAPVAPSAQDMLSFIRIALNKMRPDEAGMLIEGMANLLSEEDGPATDQALLNATPTVPVTAPVIPAVQTRYNATGVVNSNRSALDGRGNRRPAQDAQIRSTVRDLNASSFQRRFPFVKVGFNTNGRM